MYKFSFYVNNDWHFYISVIIRYTVNHLYRYLSEEKAFYVWLTEYKIDVKYKFLPQHTLIKIRVETRSLADPDPH